MLRWLKRLFRCLHPSKVSREDKLADYLARHPEKCYPGSVIYLEDLDK